MLCKIFQTPGGALFVENFSQTFVDLNEMRHSMHLRPVITFFNRSEAVWRPRLLAVVASSLNCCKKQLDPQSDIYKYLKVQLQSLLFLLLLANAEEGGLKEDQDGAGLMICWIRLGLGFVI